MRKLSEKLRKKLVEANKLRVVMDLISTPAVMSRGTQEVLQERFYRVFEKGYTSQGDAAGYKPGHLTGVAAFLLAGDTSNRQQLITAAALIIAELDAEEERVLMKGV